MALNVPSIRPAALAVACFAGLAACAQDSEAELRAEIGAWLTLDETVHFRSTLSCTAALFRVRSGALTSQVRKVNSVNEGLRRLSNGEIVAFDLPGRSPNAVSEDIMSDSLPEGIAILSSGLSGTECLDDNMIASYGAALRDDRAVFVFDTSRNTLGVLQPDLRLLFVLRGSL